MFKAGAEDVLGIAAPMLGGMLSSTLLTLIVIPALYAMIKERQSRRPAEQGLDASALEVLGESQ